METMIHELLESHLERVVGGRTQVTREEYDAILAGQRGGGSGSSSSGGDGTSVGIWTALKLAFFF
jgi:hypothetical protein